MNQTDISLNRILTKNSLSLLDSMVQETIKEWDSFGCGFFFSIIEQIVKQKWLDFARRN